MRFERTRLRQVKLGVVENLPKLSHEPQIQFARQTLRKQQAIRRESEIGVEHAGPTLHVDLDRK
jgi:hypothetical protein